MGRLLDEDIVIDALIGISGSKSIEELTEECEVYQSDNRCYSGGVYGAIRAIKSLPPVQPEPQWIPVSERLPEVHESGNSVSGIYMQSNPVLVYGTCEYGDNAQFHVVTYCDDLDGNTYWSTELDAITVSGVIAWMPLPEPYKPNK